MSLPERKLTLAIALTVGLFPFGLRASDRPQGDQDLRVWVEKRVEEWQPTKEERRFDEIGWAKDIRAALRLAQEHQRPVFLFTYDGADLGTYRC